MQSPEITAAAAWIQQQCPSATGLASALEQVLGARYHGHWYPDEPDRGTAYRMLECSEEMGLDKHLERAATAAGLGSSQKTSLLKALGRIRLWVNPGEVNVLSQKGVQRIYGDGQSNPYGKLRMNIPKTKVVVMTGGLDESGASQGSGSSQGSGPSTPRQHAANGVSGVPSLALSQSSGSPMGSPMLARADLGRAPSAGSGLAMGGQLGF